eukprot:COSAG02_NODE_2317_length_9151_cov_5.534909_6_plen_104_part_00
MSTEFYYSNTTSILSTAPYHRVVLSIVARPVLLITKVPLDQEEFPTAILCILYRNSYWYRAATLYCTGRNFLYTPTPGREHPCCSAGAGAAQQTGVVLLLVVP